jgi:hypothetical protein
MESARKRLPPDTATDLGVRRLGMDTTVDNSTRNGRSRPETGATRGLGATRTI